MKKIISAALAAICLITSAVSLSSCTVKIADEGAFLAEVGTLIEKSYEVNEIFFGKGLEFEDEGKTPDEILAECKTEEEKIYLYLPVKESAKYKTREEIMNLAHAVYSASYCEYLEARGFEGISDGDAVANYARYIEDLTYGLTVNVKSAAEAMKLDRTYDISTLAISRKGRDFVAVKAERSFYEKNNRNNPSYFTFPVPFGVPVG